MLRSVFLTLTVCFGLAVFGPALAQEVALDKEETTDKLSQQAASFRKIIATLKNESDLLDSEVDAKRDALSDLSAEIMELRQTAAALATEREEKRSDLKALDTKIAEQSLTLQDMQSKADSEMQTLTEKRDALLKTIDETKAQEAALVENTAVLLGEQDLLAMEIATLRADLVSGRAEYIATSDLIAVAKSQEQELVSKIEALRETLDQIVRQTADTEERLAGLNTEILEAQTSRQAAIDAAETARRDRDVALIDLGKTQSTTDMAISKQRDLESQIAEANQVLAAARRETERAEDRAAKLAQEAENADKAVEDARAMLVSEADQTESKLAGLRQEQETAQASLAELLARIDDAKSEVSGLAQRPSIQDAAAVRPAAPVIDPVPVQPVPRGSIKPAERVNAALNKAPGLSNLTGQQKTQLGTYLQSGVCVHEALGAVLDVVNRQTLLSIIRDLGRC